MTEQLPTTVSVKAMPAGLEVPVEIQFEIATEDVSSDASQEPKQQEVHL